MPDAGQPASPHNERMWRLGLTVVSTAVLLGPAEAAKPLDPARVWFAPGPGTLDMLRLFEAPDEWRQTRRIVDVFKFYHQHAIRNAPPDVRAVVGPNRYEALAAAGAFGKVVKWGMRIALEAGSVKEFYCTPDDSGMRESIALTLDSLAAIRAAGGEVTYLTMDEPFLAGQSPRCGGPAFEPTADRVRTYITAMRGAFPGLRIGLIEVYPHFRPVAFRSMLRLMRERGTPAAFLHVDAFLPAVEPKEAFGVDMIALADLAAEYRIPFGIIIWGDNGNSDALYAADALKLAEAVGRTFRSWEFMPDHIIFQSWAESRTGQRIAPSNLPETVRNTHTNLLTDIYRSFRAGLGRGGR
jgi:hypothetical protein